MGKFLVLAAAAAALNVFAPTANADEYLVNGCTEPGFYFVFQQKGIAPLARCKKFARGSLWSCGEVAIEEAIKRFRENMARYGELAWVDDGVIKEFLDDHFPAYTTEL